MSQGIWTILMLVASNVFMTFAWYGHFKLQEMNISTGWPYFSFLYTIRHDIKKTLGIYPKFFNAKTV